MKLNSKKCKSCGNDISGKYCSNCGEKILVPEKDFSLRHFLEETLEGLTNLDLKIFKSFVLLIFRPGFLSLENINGRRVLYMKPIQLFVIINLFFFVFFSKSTAFYSNVDDIERSYNYGYTYANLFNYNITKVINEKAFELHKTHAELIIYIHDEASHKSKTFLFLLIPSFALLPFLLFKSKYHNYVQHIIFSTHCISFFILLDFTFISFFKLLNYKNVGDNEIYILIGIFFLYLFAAIKKFYSPSLFSTIVKSLVSFFSFILFLIIYRQLMTIWAINTF